MFDGVLSWHDLVSDYRVESWENNKNIYAKLIFQKVPAQY